MIGKKLSPVLEEMEATLWEYEAFNGAKPNYTLEGFRASTKISMPAVFPVCLKKMLICKDLQKIIFIIGI